MARKCLTPFHFEKDGLLHRSGKAELLKAKVRGVPSVVKRIEYRPGVAADYFKVSGIHHPALLPVRFAGVGKSGAFCYSMPLEFEPHPGAAPPELFAVQLVSLALLFQHRGMTFHWDRHHVLCGPDSGNAFLAGIHAVRPAVPSETEDHARDLLAAIRELFTSKTSKPSILSTLRKWERRKDLRLEECLEDLMRATRAPMDSLMAHIDARRSHELEVAAGLFHLTAKGRGRSVQFLGDAGEGKSTLLHQVFCDLLPRQTLITTFAAERSEHRYSSVRKLMDRFFEDTDSYSRFRSELASGRWKQFLDGSPELQEESIVAGFIRIVQGLHADSGIPYTILIDDMDRFDPHSLGLIQKLLHAISTLPLLLIFTSSRRLDLPEPGITLSLDPLRMADFDSAYFTPLWKREQRRLVFEEIFRHTFGNPAFFLETLRELLRHNADQIQWQNGEWSLLRRSVPLLPESLAEVCRNHMEHLTPGEYSFLEAAAVQGQSFDIARVKMDAAQRDEVVKDLSQKGVIATTNGNGKFRKPMMAEFIYRKMDSEKARALHSSLAAEFSAEAMSTPDPRVAVHLLRAGELSDALRYACDTAAEMPSSSSHAILPILEELERHSVSLQQGERLRLYREKANLLFRKGSYPAAAEGYRKALENVDSDSHQKFGLSVKIAESHLLNNDILSAQSVLQEQDGTLPSIQDPMLLIPFYFARGTCYWQRGQRELVDFDRALALAEEHQNHDALARGYRQRADFYLKEANLQEAKTLAARALTYSKKTRNHTEAAQSLRILGVVAWYRSLHNTAEKIFKKAKRQFQKAGSMAGIAQTWSLLGNVHVEQYRFAEALRAFQNASSLYSQLDHPMEVSLAQFNLGLIFVEQGRLKEAEKIYQRCRHMDRKSGSKRYYAYDLRALGVIAILRGFHKKADRLLRRTLEICEEFRASGDILQTKMILLMSELEQNNYRQARPLVDFLQEKLSTLQEPMAKAEIHYLLGHYLGGLNETEKAQEHLSISLKQAKKIRYFKLIGMNLMMQKIFSGTAPSRNDHDLKSAIRCFRKSKNELRLSDYLLKLYEAFPALLHEKEHIVRLAGMERLYRQIRHRPKHKIVRQLQRGSSQKRRMAEPIYEWWHSLLEILSGSGDLKSRLQKVLAKVCEEMKASAAGFRYQDSSGAIVYSFCPGDWGSDISESFHERIFSRASSHKDASLIDVYREPGLESQTWVRTNHVHSLIAIPVLQSGQPWGMWFFERWGQEPSFTEKDRGKAAFFGMASAPALESAFYSDSAGTETGPNPGASYGDFVGSSAAMRDLYKQIEKLAPLDISVLVLGESGTGKELVARHLHRNSRRAKGVFLALNCSAIPETLIESELFGYAKGAFTGAGAMKQGYIERASGGTLFLDEIGDLSAAAQAKLLRVMQEHEIVRLGETSARKVDVRFLFATHQDLKKMVREGGYRQDLFYRISVYSLGVPALRERKEDIPMLVSHFIQKYIQSFGKQNVLFAPSAMKALSEYSWPGNVREMENAIQSVLVNVETNGRVEVRNLPQQITGSRSVHKFSGLNLDAARQEFEREFLSQALQRNKGNRTQTAKELGITRQGLIQMIQRLGLRIE